MLGVVWGEDFLGRLTRMAIGRRERIWRGRAGAAVVIGGCRGGVSLCG
jgi:hypothetical protein